MPSFPRAHALVISLLSAAALGGAVAPAQAARVHLDGLRPHRASAPAIARASARAVASHTAAADPRLSDQWALQGDGPMGIASAWRQTTGGDVTVAVIDSGIDLSHPDLRPNLWTNPGEIPDNGIDDDGNGYVDDLHGWDVVDHDGAPQDANGHGTHVAGIIAARGGNGIGIAGTAWRARLMAVRVLDADARGTTSTVAEGLRYALANGARIVNLSLAGPASTPDLAAAIVEAQRLGVLVVAAAGNDGRDLARVPTFPAAYPETNVVGVAATRDDGRLASVSDFGPGADLAAPGESILSTALGGGYEWRTGTSMAAPAVTGALVLLAAARPDLGADDLRAALLGAARESGLPVEAGSLDAGAALRRVVPPADWQPAPGEEAHPSAATVPAAGAAALAKARGALAARVKARQARAAAARARARRHAQLVARAKARARARLRARHRAGAH